MLIDMDEGEIRLLLRALERLSGDERDGTIETLHIKLEHAVQLSSWIDVLPDEESLALPLLLAAARIDPLRPANHSSYSEIQAPLPISEPRPVMAAPQPALTATLPPSDDEGVILPAWPTGEVPLTPPFGWRVEEGKVVPDRDEHLVMKYLLIGRKKGYSYQQCADDLNGRRLRNRAGKRWSASAIGRVHKDSCAHAANTKWVNRWA